MVLLIVTAAAIADQLWGRGFATTTDPRLVSAVRSDRRGTGVGNDRDHHRWRYRPYPPERRYPLRCCRAAYGLEQRLGWPTAVGAR
ncbi:MAG: hypothetical protein R3B96_17290 [Pirellulaceae bacterium]